MREAVHIEQVYMVTFSLFTTIEWIPKSKKKNKKIVNSGCSVGQKDVKWISIKDNTLLSCIQSGVAGLETEHLCTGLKKD